LTPAELGSVLAEVARGRFQQRAPVALLEPSSQALQAADALAAGTLAALRVFRLDRQKRDQR
jgi:hypothetical protein